MWELDCEESWELKNWCFWTVVLEKTLESPLDCKEIQPVHPKGDQSCVHWKDWCWSWNSNTLATSCEELTHWKRPWHFVSAVRAEAPSICEALPSHNQRKDRLIKITVHNCSASVCVNEDPLGFYKWNFNAKKKRKTKKPHTNKQIRNTLMK